MLSLFSRLRERLRPERFYGLHELDRQLLPWLDFRGGFFVEAGASDGLAYSNTLYLERFRGWRGLLIEPIPKLAALCRKNRPRCLVENCALVPSGFPDKEVTMNYCDLMSIVKGAMQSEEADREHLRRGCAVQKIESYELTVPARTLSDILAEHRIGQVDFLSLDVEGYELQALAGLDLPRNHPRYLLVEARERSAIDAFLAPHYECVADFNHCDVLYRARA